MIKKEEGEKENKGKEIEKIAGGGKGAGKNEEGEKGKRQQGERKEKGG